MDRSVRSLAADEQVVLQLRTRASVLGASLLALVGPHLHDHHAPAGHPRRHSSPERPQRSADARRRRVLAGALWCSLDVVAETGSTNADLAARARAGEPSGAVLITEYQSAGRGGLGRTWSAPPGSSIAMSVLVRPHDVDLARWTWLPLLAGVAVVEALRRAAEAYAGGVVHLCWGRC